MTTRTKSRTGGTGDRRSRGWQREGASFPVGPSTSQLPPDYTTAFAEIKERIRKGRLSEVLVANAGLVLLYWDIGRAILDRQGREGWGAKVIDRLSQDLRDVYPDMQGLSPRNLKYMRALAAAWPDRGIVQRTVAQIPWRSNVTLLDKVKDAHTRLWSAQRVREEGWSRDVLAVQIESRLHERAGKTIANFPEILPPEESDRATQVFKDPYLFDFLGAAASRTEREIEQALVDHVQRFLLELGAGFAFVGRQVLLEVGDQEFYADLLLYRLKLRRYVVVELKAVPFNPAFVGRMNLYLSAVDDLLRHPDDKPAIGLLLCKSKDRLVVEYALRGFDKPMVLWNGRPAWSNRFRTSCGAACRASTKSRWSSTDPGIRMPEDGTVVVI